MTFIWKTLALILVVLATVALPVLANGQSTQSNDRGWPRKFVAGGYSFGIYQPQVEEWAGIRFSARAAFEVNDAQKQQPSYGVLWFTARTHIDTSNRLVTLSDFKVTRVNFPSANDRALAFQDALQNYASSRGEVIALDRLLTDMAANASSIGGNSFEVKNDAPLIFFSTRPAVLVSVDGAPEFRALSGTRLERVLNSRALLLRDPAKSKLYLRVLDGWVEAPGLNGPWTLSSQTDDLKRVLEQTSTAKQVASSNNNSEPSLKDVLPTIYVSTVPAELLQTSGEPTVAAIDGTQLIYVTNSENHIFVDTPSQTHFILIAGRWFSSTSMNGPWQYVAPDHLPADFARIPETHPKASVLVAVAGTPQAKEALIANSIPQTATVKRSATFTVNYDGAPVFKAVSGTSLMYAVNTATPVLRVSSQSYFAVQRGVWFAANSAAGPWIVATSVPAVIYSIPVSSSLHYVTYVKVYESTPEVVYVGYTPGYYGTVASSGVVVYGTGWYYPPYVSATYWYGTPYTYGYGAAFSWGVTSGWALAHGYGYAWSNYRVPNGYGPVYGYGGVAAANVYGQWGNVAYSGTRAAWANPYTGNVGYGGVYTGTNSVTGARYAARGGTNTNVYTGTTATGGAVAGYNPNTGRAGAGQAGAVSNLYTGHAAAGARGVTYNPQTGVISGGSAGVVRNGSTGEVSAGGSRFKYNTNTNTGVAVANNNVYASKNGDVYRYNPSTGVQQHANGGWETVQRSQDRSWVQNQNQARSVGQQRTQSFGSMRANVGSGGGAPRFSGRRR